MKIRLTTILFLCNVKSAIEFHLTIQISIKFVHESSLDDNCVEMEDIKPTVLANHTCVTEPYSVYSEKRNERREKHYGHTTCLHSLNTQTSSTNPQLNAYNTSENKSEKRLGMYVLMEKRCCIRFQL